MYIRATHVPVSPGAGASCVSEQSGRKPAMRGGHHAILDSPGCPLERLCYGVTRGWGGEATFVGPMESSSHQNTFCHNSGGQSSRCRYGQNTALSKGCREGPSLSLPILVGPGVTDPFLCLQLLPPLRAFFPVVLSSLCPCTFARHSSKDTSYWLGAHPPLVGLQRPCFQIRSHSPLGRLGISTRLVVCFLFYNFIYLF